VSDGGEVLRGWCTIMTMPMTILGKTSCELLGEEGLSLRRGSREGVIRKLGTPRGCRKLHGRTGREGRK